MDALLWTLSLLCHWLVLAGSSSPQPNVISDGKQHGLYLWIYLKDGADVGSVMRKVAKLQTYVEELCPGSTCRHSESDQYDDEVLAGVGFGYDFYSQATNSNRQNYTYAARNGALGSLPYTGGDILIHAKSNSHGKLFELSQVIQRNLPAESIAEFRDTYGFVYKEGRDLSGFIDGTENPNRANRLAVAVDPETNGSYCITQEWIHNLGFIGSQQASTLEGFVGRKLNDSAELQNKPATSHVARMTSGPAFKAKKPVEIYRQSMPFGTLSGDAGLFFIGFSASTNSFDYMLSRMTGKTEDTSDDIMRLSRCISGNYWYFPSTQELERLQNSAPGAGATFRSNRPKSTPGSASSTKKGETAQTASSSMLFIDSISLCLVTLISLATLFANRL